MSDDVKTSVFSEDKDGTSPLGVVKRDPEPEEIPEIMNIIGSELGFLTGVLDPEVMNRYAPSGETWDWEFYQLDYFECPTWWIGNKPRQTGISTAFSGKAFARSQLSQGNYTGIFCSYKKEEAINKIRYVRQFLEALPLKFKKKIIRDPLQLIEWENNDGTISKIISHAQKPIRGHNGDIFLDEIAFYLKGMDQDIYDSALPAVVQVNGTIDITSTPFGKDGLFYDIIANPHRYPEFSRRWINWWECRRYLKDSSDEFLCKAMNEARYMTTEERVYTFGNERIILQFENLDINKFKQEFEGFFVDEMATFFDKGMILSCMFDDPELIDHYDPRETDFEIPIEEALQANDWPITQEAGVDVKFKKYDTIEELSAAIRRGEVSYNLFAGADIAKNRHSTHISIIEEVILPDGETFQIERYNLNSHRDKSGIWDLRDQEKFLASLLRDGVVRRLRIDGQGVGSQMAQTLKRDFSSQVDVITSGGNSSASADHMNNLYSRMKEKKIALAYDRITLEDLHSIKSSMTVSRRQSFRASEKNSRHGDAAWSLAYASLAATPNNARPNKISTQNLTKLVQPGYEHRQKQSLGRKKRSSYNDLVSGFGSSELLNDLDPGTFISNWDE